MSRGCRSFFLREGHAIVLSDFRLPVDASNYVYMRCAADQRVSCLRIITSRLSTAIIQEFEIVAKCYFTCCRIPVNPTTHLEFIVNCNFSPVSGRAMVEHGWSHCVCRWPNERRRRVCDICIHDSHGYKATTTNGIWPRRRVIRSLLVRSRGVWTVNLNVKIINFSEREISFPFHNFKSTLDHLNAGVAKGYQRKIIIHVEWGT